MRRERRRSLTRAELRAAGAQPGLLLRRYDRGGAGRGRLEQVTPEAKPAPLFVRRLTDESKASEGE